MRILLTGGAGFIGSHIARELVRQGHEVHASCSRGVDLLAHCRRGHSSLHFIKGRFAGSASVLQPVGGFDLGLHLAWYVEPGKYLHPRKTGLDRCQPATGAPASKRKAADVSSRPEHVSSMPPSDPPQSESTPTAHRPLLYAQSKLELFQALPSVGIDFAWVRFFYQYGPYEDPRRLVPVVINLLRQGQEAKLVTGDRMRDYLHIEDVASAVCAVAQSKLTGAVNIGSGVRLSPCATSR